MLVHVDRLPTQFHNIIWSWSLQLDACQMRAEEVTSRCYKLEHVRLKNLALSLFSINFILFISFIVRRVFISQISRVPNFSAFIRPDIRFLLMENKLSVRDTIIALSVVDARSRDFAQQIEWYRYWCWRAYRRLARVSVDLLVLRSRGSPHRPLSNQLYRPGLRSSPCWHKR